MGDLKKNSIKEINEEFKKCNRQEKALNDEMMRIRFKTYDAIREMRPDYMRFTAITLNQADKKAVERKGEQFR